MINFEDILSQLNNGTDAEDIAKEFTNALNTAISEKKKADEEKVKAEIEAKKAAEREGKKFQDFKEVIDDFITVIANYYPELVTPENSDDEAINEVTKTVIASIKGVKKLNDIFNTFSFATIDTKDIKPISVKDVNINAIMDNEQLKDFDSKISKFLKKMCW